MSITVTPSATIALRDTSISPNPNPVPFAGAGVVCAKGAIAQDVTLAAGTAGAALPAPLGVTTASVVAIYPGSATDLIVTVGAVAHPVPVQQPFFLYNVLLSTVTLGSVLGGRITTVVGG